jgi:hypothetical protein
MDIIKETIKVIENLGISGTLSNVVITRIGPWTLSYVRYDDGELGCGCANNEAERGGIPEDVSFIKDMLNSNVYDIIDKLYDMESSVFVNSLILSMASALSYRLWEDRSFLEKEGFELERLAVPQSSVPKFVRNGDVVALVGFAAWDVPSVAKIAREVNILELMNSKELEVIDFNVDGSNVKIFPASKSEEILSKADVVSITGETVVNGTLDEILQFSKNARTRIIYGPTSSFYPKVLFEGGIDVSLPIIFPNTPAFRWQFVASRGYWYKMSDVKKLVVKRRG